MIWSLIELTQPATFIFDNDCSSKCFEMDFRHKDNAGIEYIIAWSLCHRKDEFIPENEVLYHLKCAF